MSEISSGERRNVLAVGNDCYVAACSAAVGARRFGAHRGRRAWDIMAAAQWRIHGRGEGAIAPPLDWDQFFFIARPKNTRICKPPFAFHNVLKLTYSNLEFQNFPGRTPDPLFKWREGEGRDEREGKGKEGGEGREGTEEGRRGGILVGRGRQGRSTWAPPLETSSGSAPAAARLQLFTFLIYPTYF